MTGPALRAVAAAGLRAIAVGDDGVAYLTEDGGVAWSELAVGTALDLAAIGVHAVGSLTREWAAFPGAASTAFFTATGSGATWTARTMPSSKATQRVIYAGDSGSYRWVVLRGADIAWTTGGGFPPTFVDCAGPGLGTLRGVAEFGGYLYVCGDAGALARTATARGSASATWEALTSGTADDLLDLVATADAITAVGESGTIVYSEDGETWSAATNPDLDTLRGVAHDGVNRWVAAGDTLESVESYRGLFNHGTAVLVTKWIKPFGGRQDASGAIASGGQQGRGRVWRITLTAKRIGPHGVRLELGYDREETFAHSYEWTAAEMDAISADGEAYTLSVVPGRQVVSAIRVRITELDPGGFTYGAQFLDLTLDVGVRQGGAAKQAVGRMR